METCGFWVRLRIILLGLLGGSWVVIGRVVSRLTFLLAHNRGLRTPLITTHVGLERLGFGIMGTVTVRHRRQSVVLLPGFRCVRSFSPKTSLDSEPEPLTGDF